MKIHPWEKEYSEQKLVTLGEVVSEDTKRFIKWLKKEERYRLEGKKILDAGCGNGKNAFYFVESGANVVGYDISKKAISIAKARAERESLDEDQIKFIVHNMSGDLPNFESESVDIILDVTASNALTTPEREKYLKESFRILKQGGYMFVRTLCKDGDENAKYLIKNFPGPEKDMYVLRGSEIVERAFTKEDLLKTYENLGEVKLLDKIFHYPKFDGKVYKRAYWIMYLQK